MPRRVNTYRYRNIYFNIYFEVVFITEWDPGRLVILVTRRRSELQGNRGSISGIAACARWLIGRNMNLIFYLNQGLRSRMRISMPPFFRIPRGT
jgi:hypothetical protein